MSVFGGVGDGIVFNGGEGRECSGEWGCWGKDNGLNGVEVKLGGGFF